MKCACNSSYKTIYTFHAKKGILAGSRVLACEQCGNMIVGAINTFTEEERQEALRKAKEAERESVSAQKRDLPEV